MRDGRPTSIRTLLIINLVLLSLTILVALSSHKQTRSSRTAHIEEQLGMELAYSRGPIALFVDEAEAIAFKLFDTSQDLLIFSKVSEQGKQDDHGRITVVSLGNEFEMRFDVSLEEAGPRVSGIVATINDTVFIDLNADGVYDTRILPPKADSADDLSLSQVWYAKEWIDAQRESGLKLYKRLLLDGTEVEFDQTRGEWIAKNRE